MKRNAILLYFAMLVLVPRIGLAGDPRSDARACIDPSTDPDRMITACTELLKAGIIAEGSEAIPYVHRGNAYLSKGQLDQAIQDYGEAIRLDPGDAFAYHNRGLAYSDQGKLAQAIGDYGKAIQLMPHPVIYTNRAIAYRSLGQHREAILDFEEAIQLDPRSPRARNGLAWLLATAGTHEFRDGSRAVENAEQAVQSHDHYLHRATLAAAYAQAGRFSDAVREQEHAIALLRVNGGSKETIAEFEARVDLYKGNQPFRE